MGNRLVWIWIVGLWLALTAVAQNQPKPAASKPYIIHMVKFGETLTKIAQKYGVTKTEILEINPSLSQNSLYPEQIIRIPNKNPQPVVATPAEVVNGKKQDTLPSSGKHKVEKGQTLYSIAKQYNVSMDEIKKWNGLPDNNLPLGKELFIRAPGSVAPVNIPATSPPSPATVPAVSAPVLQKDTLKQAAPPAVTAPVKTPSTTPVVKPAVQPKAAAPKKHKVVQGDNLYNLAKRYKVTVDQLKTWNKLKSPDLSIGQLLIVQQAPKVTTPAPVKTAPVIAAPPSQPVAPVPTERSSVQDTLAWLEATEKPETDAVVNETQKELASKYKAALAGGSPKTQKGTGAPMTTSLGAMDNVYFAMHKFLPIGTVIRIKNLVNSKVIYAKVIGKLPESDENKHVIVRYSMGIKNGLLLQNGKCYVQVDYP